MLSRLWMPWCRNGDDDVVDSVVGWCVDGDEDDSMEEMMEL
ncbi:hypothetical protein Tco_1552379, partial [Tanacetum coccineum]